MSWSNRPIGMIRLLLHRYEHEGVIYYELLESESFSYDFSFKNITKNRPYSDWMSEMINDSDYTEQYNDIFKDVKEKDFTAEIIAELRCQWGYSGGEYNEYYEESWFENEKFRLLTDKDIKEYDDLQKPYVQPPDIVFQENTTLNDWSDSTVVEDSNSDLDTKIFFRDK